MMKIEKKPAMNLQNSPLVDFIIFYKVQKLFCNDRYSDDELGKKPACGRILAAGFGKFGWGKVNGVDELTSKQQLTLYD